MYCYKLNNSYTVYVDYHYINKYKKNKKKTTSNGPVKTVKPAQPKADISSQNVPNVSTASHSGPAKFVKFGSTVHIINIDTKQTCTWTLVHPDNIDLSKQTLSVSSPVGKALIGHRVGDCVSVKVPTGVANYQILELVN